MSDVKLKPLYLRMANHNKQIIMPNAGKSATGAKRGKIRARRVTCDVGFTPYWLKRKTSAINNVCSDWVGESAKQTLANSTVAMKPSKNHPCWSKFEMGNSHSVPF